MSDWLKANHSVFGNDNGWTNIVRSRDFYCFLNIKKDRLKKKFETIKSIQFENSIWIVCANYTFRRPTVNLRVERKNKNLRRKIVIVANFVVKMTIWIEIQKWKIVFHSRDREFSACVHESVCVCAYVKYFTTYSATNTNTITADNIFLQEIFGSSLYSHCFTSVCKFVDFFVASVRMWWSECVRLKWIIII